MSFSKKFTFANSVFFLYTTLDILLHFYLEKQLKVTCFLVRILLKERLRLGT